MIACTCLPAAARRQSSDDGTAKKPLPESTPAHPVAPKSSSSVAKTSTSTHTTAKRSSRKKSARARGQQKIDSGRVQEIQNALVREHYLSGAPTGTWNQASEDAMRRYQADHGWQSKTVPDSRALISLGLGPSKDHLLNPESAMTTVPEKPHVAVPAAQTQASRVQSTPAPSSPAKVPTPAPSDQSSPQ
jgi:hypothetical protein